MKATEKQKEGFKRYYQKNKERLDKRRKELYYQNHDRELARQRKAYRADKKRYDKVAHEWNKKRLAEVIKILGSKCCRCGYDNVIALEVHHKDNTTRKTRRSRDYLKLDYDLTKVELICANCHKLIHYKETKTVKNLKG